MNITLTNSVENISISLPVDFDSTTDINRLIARHSTLSGKDATFNYGNYDTFAINVRFVQVSDSLKIRQWWENQDELFYTSYDQSTSTVHIVNDSLPLPIITWPNWTTLEGTLNLGEI